MAIFIMLNNFFHDFAVAILVSALVIVSYLYKTYNNEIYSIEQTDIFRNMYNYLKRLMAVAWIVIILGGIVRTLTYKEYEWVEAAGKGQIAALIIKHILLITLVIWGIVIQTKLKKEFHN